MPNHTFQIASLTARNLKVNVHTMRTLSRFLTPIILVAVSALAQQPTFQDRTLDHLIGTWVLQGTIAGSETGHEVTAEWVLGHQ
jgi:hypothetical protein